MKNRATQSALLVAGVASVAAAVTWLGKRRLMAVSHGSSKLIGGSNELIEPETAELPVGRSADPEIDRALSRQRLARDETSGAALFHDGEPFIEGSTTDASLDEVWDSLPAEGEQTEGYDAVTPENLGSLWLERATQTTHANHSPGSDPSEVPELASVMVREATLVSSRRDDTELLPSRAEDEDDDIGDDELNQPTGHH